MAKRPSLKKQVVDKLASLARFGESKFEAKQQAIADNNLAGIRGWNSARTEGIFSIQTMLSYRRESIKFVAWAQARFGCKFLSDTRQYVTDYLEYKLNNQCSPWTLQHSRAALRKLFGEPHLGGELRLSIRRKSLISRSRGPKLMDWKFSFQNNRDLVDFCRATGLRRHELQALSAGDVYRADGRLFVYVRQGKGGRPRTVPILDNFADRVAEIIRDKQPTDPVIDRIPCRADIHGFRREFASALYRQLTGGNFDPRQKDMAALQVVSAALGHNRLDVVTRNYLD